jgi:hypothetical protein
MRHTSRELPVVQAASWEPTIMVDPILDEWGTTVRILVSDTQPCACVAETEAETSAASDPDDLNQG